MIILYLDPKIILFIRYFNKVCILPLIIIIGDILYYYYIYIYMYVLNECNYLYN